jgi:hypothetical protein
VLLIVASVLERAWWGSAVSEGARPRSSRCTHMLPRCAPVCSVCLCAGALTECGGNILSACSSCPCFVRVARNSGVRLRLDVEAPTMLKASSIRAQMQPRRYDRSFAVALPARGPASRHRRSAHTWAWGISDAGASSTERRPQGCWPASYVGRGGPGNVFADYRMCEWIGRLKG